MQQQWKDRVNEILQVCQEEFKKTTQIGKKMVNASKTNTDLNEAYKSLGQLVRKELNSGRLSWDHTQAKRLMETIAQKEEDLEVIEREVRRIKVAPGPEDISKSGEKKLP